MDIKRDTSGKKRRQLVQWAIGLAAVATATYGLSTLERAAPTVDRATLWMDTVKRGELLVERRGAGTLVPEEVRAIAARSAGRVEEIVLLPGAAVEPDTVVLRLSNPDLELAAANAASDLSVERANYRGLEVSLRTQRLQRRSQAAVVQSDYQTARIQYQRDLELFEERLVSERDMRMSKLRAENLEYRQGLEQRSLEIFEDQITAQLEVAATTVRQREARQVLAAADLVDLNVKSGIYGVLQEMPMEVGQSVTPGMVLARVVQPDKLKAELRIPETQAKDIVIGQPAIVDIRTAKIPGVVTRIDPAAAQGTVTVDVKLLLDQLPGGKLSPGARPQLSIDGTVEITRLADVLYTGKPAYGQSNQQVGLFKVVDDGDYAVRTTVQLGLGSVNLIEIIQGLNEGDEVILSDMSRWDSVNHVRLR